MVFKFGKYQLLDWNNSIINTERWCRSILLNENIAHFHLNDFYSEPIKIISIIPQIEIIQKTINKNELLSIEFKDRLTFVQNMFDVYVDKIFQIDEIEFAKSYVDNFLSRNLDRINQLISFL